MTTKHLILGVDPGLSGAFAWIDPMSNTIAYLYDAPSYKEKGKSVFDVHGCAQIIGNHADSTILAVVEKVHAMPKQGVVSMFNFGHTAGSIYGVLAAFKIPVLFTTPQSWKQAYDLIGCSKDGSRVVAAKYFPTAEKHFAKKKDDGRAEACLIAAFGASIHSVQSRLEPDSKEIGNIN